MTGRHGRPSPDGDVITLDRKHICPAPGESRSLRVPGMLATNAPSRDGGSGAESVGAPAHKTLTGRRAPRGSASPQRSLLTSVALASRKGGTLVIPTNPFILCHTALKVPIGRTPAAGRSQPSVLTSAMTPGVLDPTRRTNLINHETIVVTVLQCPFHVQRGVAPGAAGCAGGWGLCRCP